MTMNSSDNISCLFIAWKINIFQKTIHVLHYSTYFVNKEICQLLFVKLSEAQDLRQQSEWNKYFFSFSLFSLISILCKKTAKITTEVVAMNSLFFCWQNKTDLGRAENKWDVDNLNARKPRPLYSQSADPSPPLYAREGYPPTPHWYIRAIQPNHIKFRTCSALAPMWTPAIDESAELTQGALYCS